VCVREWAQRLCTAVAEDRLFALCHAARFFEVLVTYQYFLLFEVLTLRHAARFFEVHLLSCTSMGCCTPGFGFVG